MYKTAQRPSKEQILLFEAIYKELRSRAKDKLTDTERALVVSEFVQNYDFDNSALMHKSSSGWAELILKDLGI